MTPRSTGLVTLLVSLAAGASALAQDQKPNVSGELLARADSAKFMAGKLQVD